ncbi:AEC family transporter [Falsibacillus albus]|uniref:AEC family transporter n=1 Tax=Falsibacillus albus TaxID=2478915 RepID=A0A3L7K189_9BACI|nr:AEC family transporter [Falsibacillus albus]RLQ96847.1 AEC family transporter [Falsibacillus albus]
MQFVLILLPVFIIFGIGFIGQKVIGFDPRNISTMALYLMSPFLAFRTFYKNSIDMDYLYLTIYGLGLCFGLIAIVYIVSYFKKYSRSETSSMILSSVFMNNGNYGTPVALFAFGAAGFDVAVIFMIIQQLIMSTIGIYYAAKGSDRQEGARVALMAVVRMPIMYGAILGIILQLIHFHFPRQIYKAIDMISDATVPTIMIILGMQLATISLRNLELEKMTISLIIKFILSPLIATAFAFLLPVSEVVRNIMILMAAMPTAANTTMFALQFNAKPEFVSSVTLVSTLMSIITLPIMLYILGV